ncbi:MAG TPA: hypothetical protein VHE12_05335 [bacterium]|nr:hypothetical protein [bacterium]
MKRHKKVSLMVLALVLAAAMPALILGQTAPTDSSTGGVDAKPTPSRKADPTPTPVVDNHPCEGGFKGFKGVDHWDGTCHLHQFGSNDREGCGHD